MGKQQMARRAILCTIALTAYGCAAQISTEPSASGGDAVKSGSAPSPPVDAGPDAITLPDGRDPDADPDPDADALSSEADGNPHATDAGLPQWLPEDAGDSVDYGFYEPGTPAFECAQRTPPPLGKTCPNGTVVGATYRLVNGVCGLEFMCPSSAIVSRQPSCEFALPTVCARCYNGETECAHYAIVNGRCIAEICVP